MNAFHSKSARSSQSSRSSSAGSYDGAEPAPEHEVLRGCDRGDQVDLEEAELPDRREDVRRRAVEQLRADGDPPGLLDRDRQRRTRSSPTARASLASARSNARVERRRGPNAVLSVEGLDDELAAAALRLQVGPAGDPVAPEEREDVVAVPALVLALVDLDQVVEAEDPARERSVPEQVVEGGEEDAADGAGRSSSTPAATRTGAPPSSTSSRSRLVGLDQCVDVRPDPGDAASEPPVLDDARLGERASGTRRRSAPSSAPNSRRDGAGASRISRGITRSVRS